jgi:hypothetical protein
MHKPRPERLREGGGDEAVLRAARAPGRRTEANAAFALAELLSRAWNVPLGEFSRQCGDTRLGSCLGVSVG